MYDRCKRSEKYIAHWPRFSTSNPCTCQVAIPRVIIVCVVALFTADIRHVGQLIVLDFTAAQWWNTCSNSVSWKPTNNGPKLKILTEKKITIYNMKHLISLPNAHWPRIAKLHGYKSQKDVYIFLSQDFFYVIFFLPRYDSDGLFSV